MPIRLDDSDADFSRRFSDFLGVKREAAQDVEESVRHIIAEVKAYGDRALLQLTLQFDRLDLAKTGMRVSAAEIEAAAKTCEPARSRRSNSRASASRPITSAKSRPTSISPTRSASKWGGAGPRSKRSGSMCRAAPPPIRRRC